MSICVTLHLQSRVASIVEVLAKAALTEISQVINESTAEWSLELSRSKKENDALKRKVVQIESELQAARGDGKRRAGPRESGVEMCSVGVQDWISLWRDGGLTALKQEASPLQPVSKEEATEPVEDRLNLFPVKAESFAENSDPQRGLTISKQMFFDRSQKVIAPVIAVSDWVRSPLTAVRQQAPVLLVLSLRKVPAPAPVGQSHASLIYRAHLMVGCNIRTTNSCSRT
ncbi:hypothetical protein AAFF_G00414060 [Aldrovandia affinis]|uniref:Uncharacterized protein n=1 Tax=Aldrovandia affinis TaxID=143900 RepID=A0AAD7SBP2_9TELE|nr:hypothetical protein AAFF_G00414060 [Aldrovandia affinis]